MTVFKHPNGASWSYDFWFKGQRYTGSTNQTTQAAAKIVESDLKKSLRLQVGGLAPAAKTAAPRFQDWAEVYLEDVYARRAEIKAPERIEGLLRVVLRFFGRRPEKDAVAGAPYHDLRLDDLIIDAKWILAFEDWMRAQRTGRGKAKRPLSGQTKNQYRSAVSQMYALALRPEFRADGGVDRNPMIGVPRDRGVERTSTVTVDELRAWLRHASYHVRLAVAIAALAPKLRLANVLKLRWKDLDPAFRFITVREHKTEGHTHRPLVVPIVTELREILEDAKARRRSRTYVVTYRGKPVKDIGEGIRGAAEAAGLEYGRFGEDSVTFHTIRHTMATLLAELSDLDGLAPLDASVRQKAMGHLRAETTERYTHIRPSIEARALQRLSKVTPIADVVTAPWTRVTRKKRITGKTTGTRGSAAKKVPVKATKAIERRTGRKRSA